MKKHAFLTELYAGKKIQVVNPSEDMKVSYLRKSESYLQSAKLLRDNEHFEEAVSMAYYSMYYSVMALFFRAGIKCENHSAAILLLQEVFGIDNTDISTLMRERIDKQNYVDTVTTIQDVEDLIRKAESFNAKIFDRARRCSSSTRATSAPGSSSSPSTAPAASSTRPGPPSRSRSASCSSGRSPRSAPARASSGRTSSGS